MLTGKTRGRAKSLPLGVLTGVGIGMAVTILFCVLIAQLVIGEHISESAIGYWTMGILLIASALGAWIGVILVKSKRMQTCLLVGSGYLLVLILLNAVFFGGQFQGIVPTVLMVLIGVGGVGLLSTKERKRSRKAGKKYHSR